MEDLNKFAKEIRLATMKELDYTGFGHYGGALSMVELLAALYGKEVKINPNDLNEKDRDFVVLSKGHSGPSLYATLILKKFMPYDWIKTLNKNGTNLPSHPDRLKTPGVDMTTGSLGQGVSVATGMAYGLKFGNRKGNVYAIVGDGELNEGQCWEAIQFASAKQLDNFYLFIDWNKKQNDGWSTDINLAESPYEEMRGFNFDLQLIKGTDANLIYDAIQKAKTVKGKPHCIVLDTTKGQGIPYLEQLTANHHVRPTEEMTKIFRKEIDRLEKELAKED